MGRPQGALERDGSPIREFAFWLRDLRNRSGLTYEQVSKEAHYATSTVQAAAAGTSLPTLPVIVAFVRACQGDVPAWRSYWTQIRRLLDKDSPDGIRQSVLPPWADSAAAGPAAAPGADAPDGYYNESCTALLRLDIKPIESIEQRVVVAAVDGLSELATSMSVPRHPDDAGPAHRLDTELLHGGSLQLSEQPYESYFRNVIVLPRPLRRGERHEYAMRFRIPPEQPLASHFVYVPLCRTDRFEARVRFDPARLPQAVWLLSGVPTAVIYDRGPARDGLAPDRFGEIRVSFGDLRLGLAYGMCWED